MARVLKIFFHDACFDGTTSAAVFSAFYRAVIDKDVDIRAVGMIHKDGDPFVDVPLDADDHACVDFRFCANPKMRWWFDHHATAFQPESLRDVFDNQRQPTWFYDPVAPSCAGLIAETLRKGWNWDPPAHLIEAVKWADIIDAAKFASAEEAVALNTPAQRLAAWLAHGRTRLDTADYIEWLSRESLAEVAGRGELAAQLSEVEAERGREMEALKQLGKWAGEVIVFDRFEDPGARNPGFLGYLLFPTCLYSVSATLGPKAIKISVGVNPWSAKPRRHDIGALCARHGGGGHAVVGGVTLRPDEVPRARSTVAAMVRELNEP
ncbi:MAG: phosphoesterase [Kofleriaceae bacterium]